MTKYGLAVDAYITLRLDTPLAPSSPNRISAQQMKEWAVEYLSEYDKELTRFPELANQLHWNLWMMNVRNEDALFAVLIFRADEVEFFCGTGDAFEVKRFAERDFPDNPNDVLSEMAKRFFIPEGSIRLERHATEEWLGRGW